MNHALLYARRALDDYAAARNRVHGLACLHRTPDHVMDEAITAQTDAENRAIEAIREAVPGPACVANWGKAYRGNRGLRLDDQLIILIEPECRDDDFRDSFIIVVPLGAIEGMTVDV